MNIQGLPIGSESAKTVGGKQAQDVKSSRETVRADSVTRASQVDGYEKHEALTSPVETEYEPRLELLEQVTQRISSGEYNTQAVLERVAERIAEQHIVTDTDGAEVSSDRNDDLDEITENVSENYYERPEVQYEIARRVLEIVHPSRIDGDW